ncbi:hypothetical protein JXL21_02600 [Candidatus Bathyarchaeota archaeon]|nr:hypothetical protein [Candidatus Bathyarchaeota archaeon]
MATDYVNDTLDLINEITERFTIEYVTNNTDCSSLNITVYNYGNVNVTLDLYVYVNGAQYNSDFENPLTVPTGERAYRIIAIEGEKGESVGINAHSRRQNNDFYTYVIN